MRLILILFLSAFALLSGFSRPVMEEPKELEPVRIEDFEEKHPQPWTAEVWYEWALAQIRAGDREGARRSLSWAIDDPLVAQRVYVQLGFLSVWDKDWDHAYHEFRWALEEAPCEKDAIVGLGAVAVAWSHVQERENCALALLEEVNACAPDNADTLFYLGRLLVRKNRVREGQAALRRALVLAPQYTDAAVVLGNSLIRQQRWIDAQALLVRYSSDFGAKAGLARIAAHCGDDCLAAHLYGQVVRHDPCDEEARVGLARALAADRQFCRAKRQYQALLRRDPCNESHWRESMEVKSHTDWAVLLESTYTQAKESDPSIGQPVVRDFYFYEAFHLFVPVCDQWRLDLKQILYRQKEEDIFPPTGINYDNEENGAQLTSSYFFFKDWRWDLVARTLNARGKQNVFFPFESTTRFEPGSLLMYRSEELFFVFDGHVESFIIKNFSNNRSQLLQMNVLQTGFGIKPDWPLKPAFEGWVGSNFYRDLLQNKKDYQSALLSFRVPFLPDIFRLNYLVEHSHFRSVTPNYYSYRQQLRNTVGLHIHMEYTPRIFFNVLYDHNWKFTQNLVQPIGSFIFIAGQQMLLGDRLESRIGYRWNDQLRAEIGGHYYRDTLPYRDWNVNGSLFWQF